MKKRWIGAALLTAALLAGCGTDPIQNAELNGMRVEEYVALGDYKNMTVDVAEARVDDAEWDELLLAVYQSYVTVENGGITDRPVAVGDTVNIDYVGTRDGVAFSGGTASGANLKIGSNSYIEGFESGLVGVKPGETATLNLSFPAGYGNAELAGQPVVFTVTVNFIQPGAELMRDSVVAGMKLDGVSTVAGLRQYVYDYLKAEAEQKRLYSLQDAIIKKLEETSTIKNLPDAYYEKYRELYRNNIEKIASNMNTTADVYSNYYFGMSSEDYVSTYGDMQARQELLLQAVANREGLTVGDEELETLIGDYTVEMGYQTSEEMLQEISKEQLRNYFMSEKVMNYLVDNVQTASAGAEK